MRRGLVGTEMCIKDWSNLKELDEAVEFISAFGNDLTVLQCTTAYPTPPDRVGLIVMNVLRERYPDVKAGLSEHTAMAASYTHPTLPWTRIDANLLDAVVRMKLYAYA